MGQMQKMKQQGRLLKHLALVVVSAQEGAGRQQQ
jgi:hypothetical protein